MTRFAERLKWSRQKMGITQTAMAARLGIPIGTYKGYETGRREPGLDLVAQIARVCGVHIDALLQHDPPLSETPTETLLYYLRGQDLPPEDIELIHDLLEARRLRRERQRPPT